MPLSFVVQQSFQDVSVGYIFQIDPVFHYISKHVDGRYFHQQIRICCFEVFLHYKTTQYNIQWTLSSMQHGSTPNYWWAFLAICILSLSKLGWGRTGS